MGEGRGGSDGGTGRSGGRCYANPVRGVRGGADGRVEVALCAEVLVALIHRLSALRASKSQVSTWSGGALGGARARLWLTCTRMKSLEALEVVAEVGIWAGSSPPPQSHRAPSGTMTILSPVLAIRT